MSNLKFRSDKELPGTQRHHVVLVFLVTSILFTFPILLNPEQVYLTAPTEYHVFQAQEEWGTQWFLGHESRGEEYIDHGLHMGVLDEASAQLRELESPILLHSDFTVPPSYVLSGAVVTMILPLSTVVFHNLFFVGSMFLAGLFMYFLVREVVGNPEVALLSGILYMSSFYLFYTYTFGHTNQWQIQWIPLVLFGVERVASDFEGRNVVLLALALSLQVLSSEQYTVYLSFFLPLYVSLRYLCGASKFRSRAFWKGITAASVLSVLAVWPYVAGTLLMTGNGVETRTLQTNMYHWYVIERTNVVGVMFAADALPQVLFRLLLLAVGAGAVFTTSRHYQLRLLPFAVLFVVGLSFAWGPFSPWAPYTILYEFWPFVEYFRVPYRTLPFALLGSSTLSAAALLHVSKPNDEWTRRGSAVIALVVGIQLILAHLLLQFHGYAV